MIQAVLFNPRDQRPPRREAYTAITSPPGWSFPNVFLTKCRCWADLPQICFLLVQFRNQSTYQERLWYEGSPTLMFCLYCCKYWLFKRRSKRNHDDTSVQVYTHQGISLIQITFESSSWNTFWRSFFSEFFFPLFLACLFWVTSSTAHSCATWKYSGFFKTWCSVTLWLHLLLTLLPIKMLIPIT